jgi:beta-phosphoglucomutase-like phosphatase (HAD superfamily)
MPLEALIFDVDGTLAETEELHREAFNETFAAFGLYWIWDAGLYRELLRVTGGRERIAYYADHFRPQGADAALARLAQIHADKTARYADIVRAKAAQPRPGVRRIITEAHDKGVRLAIATTTSPSNIEPLLTALLGPEAINWFGVIAAGDVAPTKKPSPDIYHYALQKLGCAASRCVAFEDSQNGVLAARRAVLPVIATPSLYSSNDDFSRSV